MVMLKCKTGESSIHRTASIIIIGTIIQQALNYILIPYMARKLGVAGYGSYAVYSAWITIINAVISFQTTQAILYIRLEVEELKERIGAYLSMLLPSIFGYCALLLLVILFRAPLSAVTGFQEWILLLLIGNSFGVYCCTYITAVLLQEKKAIPYMVVQICVSLFSAVLSILFVSMISEEAVKFHGRIWGYAAPYLLLASTVLLWLVIKGKALNLKYPQKYLVFCLPIMLHALSATLFGHSDRLMLNYMISDTEAGFYSFIYSVSSVICIAWAMLNSIYLPYYFDLLKAKDYKQIENKNNRLLFLFTCGYSAFLFLSPEFSMIMGGERYVPYYNCLPVISLGMYFNYLYTFCANFESYYKKNMYIAIGTIATTVINLVLNWVMIPIYGAFGASATTLVSYVLLFLFHYYWAGKVAQSENTVFPYAFKKFVKWILPAILSTILFILLRDILIARVFILFALLSTLLIYIKRYGTII